MWGWASTPPPGSDTAESDLDRRVGDLTDRGATFVEFGEHPGHRWAVMQDPEGNEFCLH